MSGEKEMFTKGPWFVVGTSIYRRPKHELYEFGGSVAGDKPLAIIHKGWHEYGQEGYPVDANAHLIAAAPTGFAAAEAAYLALLQMPLNAWRIANQNIYCALRDYIALATNQDAQTVHEHYEGIALSRARGDTGE